MMDGELAGLPGFSARQGEQEVHGVGMAIGWGADSPPRFLARLLPSRKKKTP